MQVFVFFRRNLNNYYLTIFLVSMVVNILSYIYYLDADMQLVKKIPSILANLDDQEFFSLLINLLATNLIYLLVYTITVFIIETIGKLAAKNAVQEASRQLLNADLQKISQNKFEHDINSIIHHYDNINSVIKSLFIDFPRKIMASYHFILALNNLSITIMIYCLLANASFIVIVMILSYFRKKILSKITEDKIVLSILYPDISNSIQSYKVDDRLQEYQRKIYGKSYDMWLYSTYDTLITASIDSLGTFSGQFMIAILAFQCRPFMVSNTITIEDVMYGVRSSSKFVEKMMGILEYFTDVIRNYKSLTFFTKLSESVICESYHHRANINELEIITSDSNQIVDVKSKKSVGKLFKLNGPNGVGKTTMLLKFLGVAYDGSHTSGTIMANDYNSDKLNPMCYRNDISFVQQNIPITHDTVIEYIQSVVKTNDDIWRIIAKMSDYLRLAVDKHLQLCKFFESINLTGAIRELSGGQAKFVQILAAIMKMCYFNTNILILDEPSNNLDVTKIDIIKYIISRCLVNGKIIFMVTHDERMINFPELETIDLK